MILAQEAVEPRTPPEPSAEQRAINESVRAVNRCPPIYPTAAAAIRQEGWVIVEFTVSEEGVPTDSRILDSSPPDIFDASAMEALSRCRFVRIDGDYGEAVGVQWRFVFELVGP